MLNFISVLNARLPKLFSAVLVASLFLGAASFNLTEAATKEAESLYTQGMEAYQEKALIRAADLFEKSVKADSSYVDAWYNLGAVQYKLDKFEEARYAFQKALWRAPNDQEIRYNLAMALMKLNRNDEALTQLERIPAGSALFSQAERDIAMLKKRGVQSTPSNVAANNNANNSSNAGANVAVDGTRVYAKGLVGPTGLAVGPAGELYVANYTKNSIVKIMPNGSSVVIAQGGEINGPIGMVRDPRNGNLYIANYISGGIVSVTPSGKTTTLKNGFGKPYYLYFDSLTNRLFVSEQEGNRVSVLSL